MMDMHELMMRAPFATWLIACSAGEFVGFGAAALWAFVAFASFGVDPPTIEGRLGVLALMVLAGLCEGAVLGYLQWAALRRAYLSLRPFDWMRATMIVAAAGWFLGMLPSTFLSASGDTDVAAAASEPAMSFVLSGAALFGGIAGAAFGWAQWRVLRLHANQAYLWIYANAIGWTIGLPWSYLAGSLADVSSSVARMVVVGAIAGALMGLSVAVPTGLALRRMPPHSATASV
jgi:hypothetical protein